MLHGYFVCKRTMKDIHHSIVDDTDTGLVFHEQTTMKRATCPSIDGNKDADNSIVNTSTACEMRKRAI